MVLQLVQDFGNVDGLHVEFLSELNEITPVDSLSISAQLSESLVEGVRAFTQLVESF
jgi:hypothetical protein